MIFINHSFYHQIDLSLRAVLLLVEVVQDQDLAQDLVRLFEAVPEREIILAQDLDLLLANADVPYLEADPLEVSLDQEVDLLVDPGRILNNPNNALYFYSPYLTNIPVLHMQITCEEVVGFALSTIFSSSTLLHILSFILLV